MTTRLAAPISLVLFAVAVWVGCSSGPVQNSVPATRAELGGLKKGHHHRVKPGDASCCIKHVFIIIQENRSLNNIFAGFPGANTTMVGYAEASPGSTAPPTAIPLSPAPLATGLDIDHCWYDATTAYNGGLMDGFNFQYQGDGCGTGSQYAGMIPYAYVQRSDVEEYWDIANSWVLAANFYPTELGPSFVAHQNLIAGTTEFKPSEALADNPDSIPWGCDSPAGTKTKLLTPTHTPPPADWDGPYPCMDQYHTMADLLDGMRPSPSATATPIPWRYYAPKPSTFTSIWSAFAAIKRVYNGPDWKQDVISPETQILKDIPGGKLDNVGVTWIVPDCKRSDHAGLPCSADEGPSWVADVVNAIGTRDKLWDSSVIVVLWDDWGGWYDNAVPQQLDFRGLGIRTPMLILSPYAKEGQDQGHVSLRQFEPGSILKFIEAAFNLPTLGSLQCYSYGCGLGYTDDRGGGLPNSIGLTLDFTQTPRPFGTPIPTKYSAYFLESETPANLPPDSE